MVQADPEEENRMNIRPMTMDDYDRIYALWMSCKNMGFAARDDVAYRNKALAELIRIDT